MKDTNKYFDQIIGEQNYKSNPDELIMLKRIIKADSENYTEDEKMNFQRIGLHLRMQRELSDNNE